MCGSLDVGEPAFKVKIGKHTVSVRQSPRRATYFVEASGFVSFCPTRALAAETLGRLILTTLEVEGRLPEEECKP
jgi:hypothetical protein